MNTHIVEQEVTIDELAIMINKGFVAVDSKFDEVYKRFNGIEKDIKDMKRDMATKDDIALLESHIQATNKTVYKEHFPKIRRLENALEIA